MAPPHIYISAGEASGDSLGAELAKVLLDRNPLIKLSGMGSTRMAHAGVSLAFDANQLSIVGIAEVFLQLPKILSIFRKIKNYLRQNKPDLVILIDLPDTHLRIAKKAKKLGIPVLYYVSPQIWAWRASRIKQIKKNVDHMAVLFPFEERLYQQANIPVTFVGHHLKNTAKPSMAKEIAYQYFQLNPQKKIVCLLPGSRHGEIKKHLSLLIETAKEIGRSHPDAQFVIPLAPHLNEISIKEQLPGNIKTVKHHLYDLLQLCDAAVAVSGTVTLEVALMHVPLCIIYRLNAFNYWMIKKLATTSQAGLCNIVAEEPIAKEFIQDEATAKNIAKEVDNLLTNSTYSAEIQNRQSKLSIALGDGSSSEKVADIAFHLLSNKKA